MELMGRLHRDSERIVERRSLCELDQQLRRNILVPLADRSSLLPLRWQLTAGVRPQKYFLLTYVFRRQKNSMERSSSFSAVFAIPSRRACADRPYAWPWRRVCCASAL